MQHSSVDGTYTKGYLVQQRLDEAAKAFFLVENKDEVAQAASPEVWLQNNIERFNEWKEQYKYHLPRISPEIFSLSDNAGSIREIVKKSWNKPDISYLQKSLTEIVPVAHFLSNLVPKPNGIVQTPQEFMKNYVDTTINFSNVFSWNVKSNMYSQKAAWENALNKGHFFEFDLEDIGEDIIEYAFADIKTKIPRKTGKTEVDKSIGEKRRINGIVGFSESQATKYLALAKKYADHGISDLRGVPESQRYILENLAKMGHENTEWYFDEKEQNYKFRKFASAEDVRHFNYDQIAKGIEEYRKIGIAQEQNLVRLKVGNKTYQVRQYERDILEWILSAKNEGITLSAHNSFGHDNQMITQFFKSGNVSNTARQIFETQIGDISTGIEHNFDLITALRENGWLTNFLNPKSPLYKDPNTTDPKEYRRYISSIVNTFTEQELAGETTNTSSMITALFNKSLPKAIEKYLAGHGGFVEHAALPDTLKQGILKSHIEFLDPRSKNYVFADKNMPFNFAGKFGAQVGDIFNVQNGFLNQNNEGKFAFVIDSLTGNFRFLNGNTYDPQTGKFIEEGIPLNLKKGTNVMLTGAYQLDMTDEFIEKARELGLTVPYLKDKNGKELNELIALMYTPFTRDDIRNRAFKHTSSIIELVTRSEAENRFSSDLWRVGHYDEATGNIDSSKKYVDPKVKNLLKTGKYFDFNELQHRSDMINISDTASRWIRDESFGKAKFIVDLLDKIDNITAHPDTMGVLKGMQFDAQTFQNLKIRTRFGMDEILEDLVRNNEKSIISQTYTSAFKSVYGIANAAISRNTVDNVSLAINYLYGLKDIYRGAYDVVESMGLGNTNSKNAAFNSVFENMLSIVADRENISLSDALARSSGTLPLTGREKNTFSIDISSLIQNKKLSATSDIYSNPRNYFDIYLGNDSENIGKRLARRLNIDDPVQALRSLEDLIVKQYGELNDSVKALGNHKGVGYSEQVETDRIFKALRGLREVDHTIGLPKQVQIMNVEFQSAIADKLSKYSADQIKDIAKQAADAIPKYVDFGKGISAKDYVDKYLFKDTNGITRADLKKYGYSEKEIDKILEDRARRRKDTLEYVSNLFNKLDATGRYEKDGKTFYFADRHISRTVGEDGKLTLETINGELDITKNMFFDRFDWEHGSFYSQYGGRKLSTVSTFSTIPTFKEIVSNNDKAISKVGITSVIRDFSNQIAKHINYLDSSYKTTEDALEGFSHALSRAGEMLSDYTITRFDMEDVRFGNMYQLTGLFERLGFLNNQGIYDNIKLKDPTRDVLDKLSRQSSFNLDTNDKIALYKDISAILSPFEDADSKAAHLLFANKEDAKEFARIVPILNSGQVKHLEHDLISASNIGVDPFATISADPANRYAARNRSLELEVTDNFIKKYEKLGGTLRIGSVFQSERDRLVYDGISGTHRTKTLQLERTNISTESLYRLLSDEESKRIFIKNGIKNQSAFYKYLEEGGALMDPRLLELIPKTIEQKVSKELADLNFIRDHASAKMAEDELKRLKQTDLIINLVKGDNLGSVEYSKGIWINAGDTIGYEKTHKNTLNEIKAKRDGFLRSLYYDREGRLVSEAKLNEILLNRGLKDSNVLLQNIDKILSDEGITKKLVVESVDAAPYRKSMAGVEKFYANYFMARIGSEDTRIRSALENTGVYSKMQKFLTDSVIRDESKFEAMLTGLGMDSTKSLKDSYRQAGFSNYNEFVNAIYKERYSYWDTMMETFRNKGIAEYVSIITNTDPERIKSRHLSTQNLHENFAQVISDISSKDGISTELATKKLYDRLINDNVFSNGSISYKNGHIIISDAFQMNADKLNQIFEEHGRHYNKKFNAYTGTTDFAGLYDNDMPGFNNGKNEEGIYATRRMTTAMEREKWGQLSLDKTWQDYQNLEKSQRSKNAAFNAKAEFDQMFKGVAHIDDNMKVVMEEGVAGTSINRPLIEWMHQEIVAGGDASRMIKDGKIPNAFLSEFEEYGISRKEARSIVDFFGSKGFKDVSFNKVLEHHSYTTGLAAIDFNHKIRGLSDSAQDEAVKAITESKNSVFKRIDIEDLATAPDSFIKGAHNNIFQPLIIDLGEDSAFRTKDGSRYIAMPFIDPSIMGRKSREDGILAGNQLIRDVKSLAHAIVDISSSSVTARENKESYITELIDKVSKGVVSSIRTKEGALANLTSGYLAGSAMFKSDTMQVIANDIIKDNKIVHPFLEKAMMDGMSIADHVRAGKEVNAVFLGEDFFKNQFNSGEIRKLLGNLGLNEKEEFENMLARLEKEGSVGIGLRQPMGYSNSVVATQIYLDRSLSSNQMKLTRAAAEAMKSDMDGDQLYASMITGRATIQDKHGNVVIKDGKALGENIRLTELQAKMLSESELFKKEEYKIVFDNPEVFSGAHRAATAIASGALSGLSAKQYEEKVRDLVSKSPELTNVAIDGKVYSRNELYNINKNRNLKAEYEAITSSEAFQTAISDYNASRPDKAQVSLETMASDDLAGREIIENKDNNTAVEVDRIANRYLNTIQDSAERERAAEALAFGAQNLRLEENVSAYLENKNTGLLNYNTNRFNQIMGILQDKGLTNTAVSGKFDSNANIINATITHIEDTVQAAKNVAGKAIKIDDLGNAIEDFLGAKSGVRNKEPLYNMIRDMYEFEGMKKALGRVAKYEGDIPDNNISLERIFEAFDSFMPDDKIVNPEIMARINTGFANKYNESLEHDFAALNSNDLKSVMDEGAKTIANKLHLDIDLEDISDDEILLNAMPKGQIRSHFRNNASSGIVFTPEVNEGFGTKMASAFDGLQKAFRKPGAIGLLGLGGALMMAGVAGGAPTSPKPADGQAEGIQNQDGSFDIPSTMSGTGYISPNTANQGYIINIDASTSRGRDFATNAINQAFAKNQALTRMGGNINMTMNIKDSSTNIGYNDILSYISNML